MEIETYFCKHKFQIQKLMIAEVYDKNLLIKSHMIIIYPSYECVMSRVLCISKLVNAATYQDRAHTTQGCRPRTTAWKNCPVFYAWIDDQGDTNTLNYDVHLRTIGFGRAHNLHFFQIDCRLENRFKSMLNWNVKFQSGCSYGTQQLLHL
jgi:hypothetical protein